LPPQGGKTFYGQWSFTSPVFFCLKAVFRDNENSSILAGLQAINSTFMNRLPWEEQL